MIDFPFVGNKFSFLDVSFTFYYNERHILLDFVGFLGDLRRHSALYNCNYLECSTLLLFQNLASQLQLYVWIVKLSATWMVPDSRYFIWVQSVLKHDGLIDMRGVGVILEHDLLVVTNKILLWQNLRLWHPDSFPSRVQNWVFKIGECSWKVTCICRSATVVENHL